MPARSLHGFLNPLEVKKKSGWVLAPLYGSIAFIILYLIAASLYPGGSQADATANGFSWMHNYWCNLLNEKAINGATNTAKPVAQAAMVVLCVSLLTFWLFSAQRFPFSKSFRRLIIFSGILSVAVLPALSSSYHDIVIDVAGVFGLIAMAGIYIGLYKSRWMKLFVFGLLVLFLIAVNNYLYYAGMLYWLPVVQKITFLCCLLWICMTDLKFYHQALEQTNSATGQSHYFPKV